MSGEQMIYPDVARNPKTIKFEHGAQIVDHYQWLEETNSETVRKFLKAQKALTTDFLQKCKECDVIKKNLRHRIDRITSISCPVESAIGNYYFYMKDEADNYDSLFVQEGLKEKPRLFLSPRNITFLGRGKAALRIFALSVDGHVLAYAFSSGVTSPWFYVRFKDAITGRDFPETLMNVRNSDISWTHDGKGILYSCYLSSNISDEKNNHKIVFHRLGTKQEEDLILVEFPSSPLFTIQAQISDCGEIIVVYAQDTGSTPCHNYLFYADLKPTIADNYETCPMLQCLLDGDGEETQYIATIDESSYFRTNRRAPNFRIMKAVLFNNKLTKGLWETVISEDPKRLLDWALFVNRQVLMICYVENCMHTLELRSASDGRRIHRYDLPIGTILEHSSCERDRTRVFFTFSSFLIPDCVRYVEVPKSLNLTICDKLRHFEWKRKFKDVKYFKQIYSSEQQKNAARYCVKQKFGVNSKDGTAIPIFLIHKKNTKMDGKSPCVIYGQGCFGMQIMPSFCISKLAFVQCFNGVIAIVGVRGGGEYGRRWYRDGTCNKKQQSYDDFITATEYLIKVGYTSSSRLILEGEQFGGNLAAVCMLQRPDLYGAVIIHDGLLDLLRFHKFKESEEYIGEFGNPETGHVYDNLLKIAPLPNVLNENTIHKIPAVMALLGSDPCLTHPSNSFKFIAELQHSLVSKSKTVDERSDIFAFLIRTLGLKFSDSDR